VAERVVVPEITEFEPGVVDPRLAFVMSERARHAAPSRCPSWGTGRRAHRGN